MRINGKAGLRAIDAIGGGLVAACLMGFVWTAAVHNKRIGREIRELRAMTRTAHRDAGAVELALAQQLSVLAERQKALATTGQLPVEAPVEEYFQTLSRIATGYELRVIRHQPLTPRQYPGLLEQRYTYEVSGSMPNVARFLKAIEGADFWADVSYLSMGRGVGAEQAVVNKRVAELTLSLFSAPPPETEGENEGV